MRSLVPGAAFAALLLSSPLLARWPPANEREFAQMQSFYRSMEETLRPSPSPPRDIVVPDLPAGDLGPRDIQIIERSLPSLFFLDPGESGRHTITAPLFVLPNGERIELRARWTGVFDGAGRNVQRPATADESRRDAEVQAGEYAAAVYAKPGETIASVAGTVEAAIPLKLFRADFDCSRPARVRMGPRSVALVRCVNDFVELRETGGRLEEEPDIRVYGAAGRLHLVEQGVDPVFAGGKTILDFRFANKPSRIEGRRFRLLVQGTARRVTVFFPAQMARKTFEVRAVPGSAGNEFRGNRFLRPAALETGTFKVERHSLRGRIPAAVARGGQEIELILPLADHPGSRFALCRVEAVPGDAGVDFQAAEAQAAEGSCRARVRKQAGTGRLRGTWKVRYPLSYTAVLSGAGEAGGVNIRINGGTVILSAKGGLPEPGHVAAFASFSGRLFPLQPLQVVSDGPLEKRFWGSVEKIWFARLGDWTEYEVNFDLPAPPEAGSK